MARQQLTVQRIKSISETQEDGAGFTPAFSAAVADGFYAENDGQTSIRVRSTSTPVTVTIPHPATKDGLGVEDLEFALGEDEEQEIAFLGPGFNQAGTNQIHINFSAITGVSVAAISYR